MSGTNLCLSLSLFVLSPCHVSPHQETPACPLQWPRPTPRPNTPTHTHRVTSSVRSGDTGRHLYVCEAVATHVGADGVLQHSVPLVDQRVDIRLDQQLRALTGLQL